MSNTEALKLAIDTQDAIRNFVGSHGQENTETFLMLEANRALSAVRSALAQLQPSAPLPMTMSGVAHRKAADLVAQGYTIVGYTMTKPGDRTAVLIDAAVRWLTPEQQHTLMFVESSDVVAQASVPSAEPAAIDMVLHCPKCGMQHVDAADEFGPYPTPEKDAAYWGNPPHRSHLCHGCGYIWRPADVPTNGVAAVKTAGKADSPIAAPQAAPVAPEQAKADGRLHADGYFTWARRDGYAMDKKLPCDFYLAAPAAPAPAAQPPNEEAMKWRKAVQEAYGWLWHTNNEPMAPVPMWSPEQAAYQARKCLRELLTTAERGEAINAIAAHMDKIAGITAAPTKETP